MSRLALPNLRSKGSSLREATDVTRPKTEHAWKRYWCMLGAFYASWFIFVCANDAWRTVFEGWPIALAMAFGSVVAGSTPMGGGTVGFPVLVLGFDFPSSLGRDFSFAIQSVGMVSAAAFILARRQRLEWTMLLPALVGSAIGTPFGLLAVAPSVSGTGVKVAFAVLWASFGVMHLTKMKSLVREQGLRQSNPEFDRKAGFFIGLLGGAFVSSLTGVGVDMLIYAILVLLCRGDIKVAIPTSVILMAFTSVVGLLTQAAGGALDPGLGAHWLAAAPVVAIGAPFGSRIIERLGRTPLLFFVSFLCLLQFVWTMHHEYRALGNDGLALSVFALSACVSAFMLLHAAGTRKGVEGSSSLRL